MYGGLKGEDSNAEIFSFNPATNNWLNVTFSVSSLLSGSIALLSS